MSIEALKWAFASELQPMPKLVLIMLSNRHNNDSGICWPSMDKIAKDCGMSKNGVRNQIDKLSELGLLTVIPTVDEDGRQTSNRYRLNLGCGVHAVEGDTPRRAPPPPHAVEGDTPRRAPEPVIEPIISNQSMNQPPPQAAVAAAPKRSKKSADPMVQPPPSIDAETWRQFYEHRLGHRVGPMTENAQRLMLKRLEGFQDSKAAMETAIAGGWSDCKEWASVNRSRDLGLDNGRKDNDYGTGTIQVTK